MQLDIARFVDDKSAGCIARGIEILGDRRLAVGHHALAGILHRIDEKARPPLPRDGRTVVRMAHAIHPLAEPYGAQQFDRASLKRAGANSLQNVLSGLPFQHDAVDTVLIEDMREKQSSRSATDDRKLGSHFCSAL